MRPNPIVPMIPESMADVIAVFGDLRSFISHDGTLMREWEERNIVRMNLPAPVPYAFAPIQIKRITIHSDLLPIGRLLYQEIWDRHLEQHLGPYGGGFVFRQVRGASSLSLHSFGIAWDWDPEKFPLGSTEKRHPQLVETFRKYGFLCGENFQHRKDPQHFQYATGT